MRPMHCLRTEADSWFALRTRQTPAVSSFYANKTITTRRRRDDCDTQSRDCLTRPGNAKPWV